MFKRLVDEGLVSNFIDKCHNKELQLISEQIGAGVAAEDILELVDSNRLSAKVSDRRGLPKPADAKKESNLTFFQSLKQFWFREPKVVENALQEAPTPEIKKFTNEEKKALKSSLINLINGREVSISNVLPIQPSPEVTFFDRFVTTSRASTVRKREIPSHKNYGAANRPDTGVSESTETTYPDYNTPLILAMMANAMSNSGPSTDISSGCASNSAGCDQSME